MLTIVCRPIVSNCLDSLLSFDVAHQIMKEPILIQFGKKIRKERLKKGLSQEQLAHLAGVHRTYIGMVERAEKNITLLNIAKIAIALNIDISKLFVEDDDT